MQKVSLKQALINTVVTTKPEHKQTEKEKEALPVPTLPKSK
jgi:hypothetical protein